MEVKQGMVLYTNKTPIGFGRKARESLRNQKSYNAKAWPKYRRAGHKLSKTPLKFVNKKYFNGT